MRMSRSAYYQSTDRSGTGTYVSDASLLEMRFILFALSADSAILALDRHGGLAAHHRPRIDAYRRYGTGSGYRLA